MGRSRGEGLPGRQAEGRRGVPLHLLWGVRFGTAPTADSAGDRYVSSMVPICLVLYSILYLPAGS